MTAKALCRELHEEDLSLHNSLPRRDLTQFNAFNPIVSSVFNSRDHSFNVKHLCYSGDFRLVITNRTKSQPAYGGG